MSAGISKPLSLERYVKDVNGGLNYVRKALGTLETRLAAPVAPPEGGLPEGWHAEHLLVIKNKQRIAMTVVLFPPARLSDLDQEFWRWVLKLLANSSMSLCLSCSTLLSGQQSSQRSRIVCRNVDRCGFCLMAEIVDMEEQPCAPTIRLRV